MRVYSVIFVIILTAALMRPAEASEWFDANPLFEEEVRRLAEEFPEDTLMEYRIKQNDMIQYADSRPAQRGDQVSFYTLNFETGQMERVAGVLQQTGRHCYVFLEKGRNLSPQTIDTVAKIFDDKIYPLCTGLFGSEWKPGIDKDPRITLFLLDIRDAYNPSAGRYGYTNGYFYAGDCYPVKKKVTSNQREMLYIDIYPSQASSPKFMSVVAHEFQHMIHWNHDPKEFSWVNEAMSQLAMFAAGFDHPSQLFSFSRNSDNSLVAWSDDDTLANYGQVYLFMYYLMGHTAKSVDGQKAIIKNIVSSKKQGISGISDALVKTNIKLSFAEIFRNFCVANFLNDNRIESKKYGYDQALDKFKLSPMRSHNQYPAKGKGTVKVWSSRAVNFRLPKSPGQIAVNFEGSNLSSSKTSNVFDLAAVFYDSRRTTSPTVIWLPPKTKNRFSRLLKQPSPSHDNLMLVAVNRGPESQSLEKAFASKAKSAQFSYAVSVAGRQQVAASKTARKTVTASNGRRVSKRTMLSMASEISKMPPLTDEMTRTFSSDREAQAVITELNFNSSLQQYQEREGMIIEAMQTSLENGDPSFAQEFLNYFDSCNTNEKQNLRGIRSRIIDIIFFEIHQNRREELRELLPQIN